jgi:hypothetical protein
MVGPTRLGELQMSRNYSSTIVAVMTGPPSSSRYSSTKSKTNGNFEMKHSTATIAPNTPSSTEHYSAPRPLDSTPTLNI